MFVYELHIALLKVCFMLLPVLFFSMGLLTIAYQKIHAKCNIRILKHLMCVNRSHCAALNAEVASQSDKRLKRKVALVCSYVGSNYYGLQYAKSISGDGKEIILPTIEFEIQQALIRGQLILDSNSVDLGKIMWSRSSRTDKGVHAARIVLSCKLELQPHWLDDDASHSVESTFRRLPQVSQELNLHLPQQIRVFACVQLNQGFRAREACHWREYEYLLPLSLLTQSSRCGNR
mmetsp:Transcript_8743/g.13059  ORF Transcript_8743/g.13059 Transcript_8743/m.13059 type:complete len:233 (+) Transcript_8743:2089-2787(+)